jgi:hypothetical protein
VLVTGKLFALTESVRKGTPGCTDFFEKILPEKFGQMVSNTVSLHRF